MKTFISTVVAATVLAGSVMAAPLGTSGLQTLAQTGWADAFAAEGFGTAYDETGGKPGMFTYAIDNEAALAAARELLGEGEFLAPHFLKSWTGRTYVMVAPHLLVKDGVSYVDANGFIDVANGDTVLKGANVNKDHYIIVDADGSAVRNDFSEVHGDDAQVAKNDAFLADLAEHNARASAQDEDDASEDMMSAAPMVDEPAMETPAEVEAPVVEMPAAPTTTPGGFVDGDLESDLS